MDGRTAKEVIAGWLADCRPCSCQEEVYSTPENAHDAAEIIGLLADAGLVVCADNEANLKGRAVAGRRIAPTTVHIGFRQDRFTVTCDPDSNAVLTFRLVPLDGGEP